MGGMAPAGGAPGWNCGPSSTGLLEALTNTCMVSRLVLGTGGGPKQSKPSLMET